MRILKAVILQSQVQITLFAFNIRHGWHAFVTMEIRLVL